MRLTNVMYIISCLILSAVCIFILGLVAYVNRGYFALGGESLLMLAVIGYAVYCIYKRFDDKE